MSNNIAFDRKEVRLTQASPVATVDWGFVKETTILITINDEPSRELFSIQDESGRNVFHLYTQITTDYKALSLVADLFLDCMEKPLTLSAPWDLIQRSRHEIMLRYSGIHLELFIDGILVDEEWPMGKVDLRRVKVQQYVGVTQARMISCAFSQTEIADIFGDDNELREKKRELLGTEPHILQYWRPLGFNTGVGDCMPYYDGTAFHIYYLFDRRGHRSKWGLGAHQWAHISTNNLEDWVHHPMALGITEEWEGSICTGSIFRENNRYFAFYAVRAVDGSPARLTWAASPDGIHFEKSGRYIQLTEHYHLSSVRDPVVFKDNEGVYHMLVTTSVIDGDDQQGCLAHLVSNDLKYWKEQSPFIVPGYHDQPECPDYFEWNGWYYLIFSNDGAARYRYSRNPFGPWLRPAVDVIGGIQMRVPKSAAYKDSRRLVVGFLSEPGKYGGELIIRELVQHSDGSLGINFVDELTNRKGPEIKTQTIDGHIIEETSISLENWEGFTECRMMGLEQEYYLTFEVTPGYPNMYYGFSLAESIEFKQGRDIRFDPAARKIGVHKIHAPSFVEDEASSLYNVDGLEQRIIVEAIVKKGFIDICVNGQRTIISRLSKKYDYLRFFSQFGCATFDNIKIRGLTYRRSGGLQL